jgi:hypothetical protein
MSGPASEAFRMMTIGHLMLTAYRPLRLRELVEISITSYAAARGVALVMAPESLHQPVSEFHRD